MRLKQMLAAFGFGVIAAVMVHTLVVDVDAQSGDEDELVVCVESEGAMRKIEPKASCNEGEKKLPLKLPKVQLPCEKKREPDIAKLSARIAELEGRGDERILDRTAMAPFEVVNEAGVVVFSVKAPPPGDHVAATEIFNETGGRVAIIATNREGASVSVESGVSRQYTDTVSGTAARTTLHASSQYADLSNYVGPDEKLDLGRRENGRYGLRLFGADRKVVAGFGESDAGLGVATVSDVAGNPRVTINCTAGTASGEARILDAAGKVVASLSGAGINGSGVLQLRNNADTVMVEAGMLNTGIGVVRAGPGAFQHGVMFLGLPASYIEGKK